MTPRGRFLWAGIRSQWGQMRLRREMLYGGGVAANQIRSTPGPGLMASLRCGLRWGLAWGSALTSYISNILGLLALWLSSQPLPPLWPRGTTGAWSGSPWGQNQSELAHVETKTSAVEDARRQRGATCREDDSPFSCMGPLCEVHGADDLEEVNERRRRALASDNRPTPPALRFPR